MAEEGGKSGGGGGTDPWVWFFVVVIIAAFLGAGSSGNGFVGKDSDINYGSPSQSGTVEQRIYSSNSPRNPTPIRTPNSTIPNPPPANPTTPPSGI